MTNVVGAEQALYVRPLLPDDVSEGYANWLSDPVTNRFLETKSATVSELRDYVASHQENSNSLLLGIFVGPENLHIGNIKFEPIDLAAGRAELGIMIGSPQHRGLGLGPRAIRAGVRELISHRSVIRRITLGVNPRNTPAIKAYERLGFQSAVVESLGKRSSTQDLRFEVTVEDLLR